ncbi:MAG: chorismate synthase [Promethearchaeota archaeon]|nr:MAG: chorismate synthase [Candidatus Lokiarchaeota archaeon]
MLGDNSFGKFFKITTFGESHGKVIGVIIDGVPAGLPIDIDFIQKELDQRKPGLTNLATSRKEEDSVKIISGIFLGKATGAPICLTIENQDQISADYEKFKNVLRPSHADYSALKKYGGYADHRGSGRFSGRITASFVMAGAIAKKLLADKGIYIFAYSKKIGNIEDENDYSHQEIQSLSKLREKSRVRALEQKMSNSMEKLIESIKNQKDSIGGIITCIVKGIPPGIGDPIFNNLESNLSKAIFAIPAVRGIEFGAGFKAANMKGSEHNDPWIIVDNAIKTSKNDSGGIIGGISIGMPLIFNIAIKPTASIGLPQKTVNIKTMKIEVLEIKGRHDPCIVPRAVSVVEAITAIVLVDFLMVDGLIPRSF